MKIEVGKYYKLNTPEGVLPFIIGPMEDTFTNYLYAYGQGYWNFDGSRQGNENLVVGPEFTFTTRPYTDKSEIKVGQLVQEKTYSGARQRLHYVSSVDTYEVSVRSFSDSCGYRVATFLRDFKIVESEIVQEEGNFTPVEDFWYKFGDVWYRSISSRVEFMNYGDQHTYYDTGVKKVFRYRDQNDQAFRTGDIPSETSEVCPYTPVDLLDLARKARQDGKIFAISLPGIENPSFKDGNLYVGYEDCGLYSFEHYGYFTTINGDTRSIRLRNQSLGYNAHILDAIEVDDPVLSNFVIDDFSVFSGTTDQTLQSKLYPLVPEELRMLFLARSKVMKLRQATENRANLAVYLNQKQKDAQRIQSLRPGRALRAILPEVSDAVIEQLVDKFRKEFPLNSYTIHRGFEGRDFAHMYGHDRVPMQNPRTTSSRKSLGDSCMRDKDRYRGLPKHPVEAYASGEFEAIWTEDEHGRIGSRVVVWHPPVGHRLHGKPQFGPCYGTCEYSMDLLEELAAKENGVLSCNNSTWEGAKICAIPHRGSWVLPYIDMERWLTPEGDYFILSEDDGSFEACSYGGLIDPPTQYFCNDCDDEVGEDEVTFINDSCVCDNCRSENYFYCEYLGEYVPDEDAVLVNDRLWNGNYVQNQVSQDCADARYVLCEDGEYWPDGCVTQLANGDYVSDTKLESGEYFACVVDNEWYHKDEGYFTDVGDFIAKENFDDATHYLDENNVVREKEAA